MFKSQTVIKRSYSSHHIYLTFTTFTDIPLFCYHVSGESLRLNRASKRMQMENGLTPNEKYLHDFTYHGKEFSFSEAKEVLSSFYDGSGSVDLEKDDNGIAKICLSNPRLKNAISGNNSL